MYKRVFGRLVIAGFLKSLTLSVTGMIDCAIVGRYLGADGLSAMKLAMPVFSVISLFSAILSTGVSVSVSRDVTRGKTERAGITFQTVFTISVLIAAAGMLVGIACPFVITDLLAARMSIRRSLQLPLSIFRRFSLLHFRLFFLMCWVRWRWLRGQ